MDNIEMLGLAIRQAALNKPARLLKLINSELLSDVERSIAVNAMHGFKGRADAEEQLAKRTSEVEMFKGRIRSLHGRKKSVME